MARVKKNETALTLEEKLDRALVPDWEWPNKLPENWCWVRLGTLISSSKENTSNFSTDMKYVGLEHIEKDSGKIEYGSAENVKSLKNKFCAGQILYGKLRPYLNKHGIPTFDGVCSTDILVFDTQKITIAEYINFFFDTRDFLEYTISNSRGVNLPRVSEMTILEAKCPLAPLPEQQRIVDRIESLFAKLDEAKEKAQATLDSFEARKAAILHKAFTGELTAEWRAKNNIENSWKNRRFDTVAEIRSNLVDPAEYQDYPHIAPDNIEKKTGVLLEYNTIAKDGMTSGKHRFFPGQILYSKIRPYLSKVVIVNFDGLCSADMYPIQAQKNARCLWYYMLSEEFLEQASSAGSRSVLPKINQKELSAVMVNLPDNEKEQEEIVAVLDSIFAKEQQAKEAAEMVLDQIDLMKKAILSRAFRGELGTNDPTEESALELLKQILSRKAADIKSTKKSVSTTRIPFEIAAMLYTKLEKDIVKLFYQHSGTNTSIDEILAVGKNKMGIISTLTNLEQRGIIVRLDQTNYCIKE